MKSIQSDESSPCKQGTCRNQAKCLSYHDEFYCQCPEGFTGINCDQGKNLIKYKQSLLKKYLFEIEP